MRGLLAQTAQSLNQEPSCSFAERIQVTIPLGQLNFPSVIAGPPRIPDERRQGNFKTSPDPIHLDNSPPLVSRSDERKGPPYSRTAVA